MSVSEKLGYLRGLADGLQLDSTSGSKEERLIAALIDAVEELADQVSENEEHDKALAAQIEDLSESLDAVASLVLDGLEEDEDETEYEMACPNCDKPLVIGPTALASGEITCPHCAQRFEIDLGFDLDEDN
jgi:DNA-directed RNA polymerase subunit RPC12/RpoP